MNISKFFTWDEVTVSVTAERLGLDNSLPDKLKPAAQNTATQMDKVRLLLNNPIFVHSWYRGPALQALPEFINPHSQHPKAEAVDWVSPNFGSPLDCCKKILTRPDFIVFDQLILEHSWVHISFCSIPNTVPRKQVLSLLESGGYSIGLTDKKGNPL